VIVIDLKDGSIIKFSMASQIEERDFIYQAKTLDESFQVNLGKKGKHKISDIQDIYFELDDRYVVQPEKKKGEINGEEIVNRLQKQMDTRKAHRASKFEESVRSRLGFVPKDNLLYQQCLNSCLDDHEESKLPLYANLFVNGYQRAKKSN